MGLLRARQLIERGEGGPRALLRHLRRGGPSKSKTVDLGLLKNVCEGTEYELWSSREEPGGERTDFSSSLTESQVKYCKILMNQEIAGWCITQIYRNKCQAKIFIEIENMFL